MKAQISLTNRPLHREGWWCFFAIFMSGLASICVGQTSISVTDGGPSPYLQIYESPTNTIRAGFIPSKVRLVQGEPRAVVFTVINLGTNHFKFAFGMDYRGTGRHDRFKIAITNTSGAALPDPLPHPMDFGGMGNLVDLKEGEVFSNSLNLTDFRVIPGPGKYQVHCHFAFGDHWPKEETGIPEVNSSFTLTILERTPERVARVLDELGKKAQMVHDQELNETLALMARFGGEAALPWLTRYAKSGPLDRRVAAIGTFAQFPPAAAWDVVLASFKDTDPAIRAAAANTLGTMPLPRAVETLLDALPHETSLVAEAILRALGTSKADRAFPVITNALDTSEADCQRAAIEALVNFGGTNAMAALTRHIDTKHLALRYEIVLALAEQLHQPMKAEWLTPVLAGGIQDPGWIDSLRLLRMHAGDEAIPALLSQLDFDVVWSDRNWWILNEVQACPKAPPVKYEYDLNTGGTPEQWETNRRTLQSLKPLAGPLPIRPVPPRIEAALPVLTDPSMDFTPVFSEIENGGVEIKSGFLQLSLWRGSASFPYTVPEAYQAVYESAGRFRALPADASQCAKYKVTPEQVAGLVDLLRQFAIRLCGSTVSSQRVGNFYNLLVGQAGYCPGDDDWGELLRAWQEAPAGPLRNQAKADLINSVQVFSQNYHLGTVEFAAAAGKILTLEQAAAVLR